MLSGANKTKMLSVLEWYEIIIVVIILLRVIYAECCNLDKNVTMLRVLLMNIYMLGVLVELLSLWCWVSCMLSVAIKSKMLSVVMLRVFLLNIYMLSVLVELLSLWCWESCMQSVAIKSKMLSVAMLSILMMNIFWVLWWNYYHYVAECHVCWVLQ